MLLQSIRDNTLSTVQNIATDSSSQSNSTLFSNILEEQTKTKAEYTNGRFGINTNDKGIPNQVSYFDESGNLLSTGIAIGITFLTMAYSLWMVKRVFFGVQIARIKRAPTLKMRLTMIILTIIIILVGIWPSPIIDLLM